MRSFTLQDELENVQAQLSFQEERLRETEDIIIKTREELKLEKQNVEVMQFDILNSFVLWRKVPFLLQYTA